MPDQPRPQWLLYAAASGAFAALNGVFAKLTTTTSVTSSWAAALSKLIPYSSGDYIAEAVIRGAFLALNITFNGVMWALFTRALTLADSTVRVSVINTSTNFVVTAVLGAVVFGESLPALWWLGAALLVTGSVIIGRRDEGNVTAGNTKEPVLEAVKSPRALRSTGDAATFELDDRNNVRKRRPK